MVRTQIQLTEEQDRRLEQLAATQNVSKAELVRRAVDLLFSTGDIGCNPTDRRRRALAAAGRFHSDQRDVAEHHDDYLTTAYQA